jgi:Family of unknown function (DUF6065)
MSDPVVTFIPLVPNLALPFPASPRTRFEIPEGYGVQEQCLPFTAASGLGFLIPSPISFGLCNAEEAPAGCRTFRSPIEAPVVERDRRVFYVFDNPEVLFSGNAYQLEGIPDKNSSVLLEAGISFFDRPDQQHLFKLHLPYVWRTETEVDTLFLPLINRAGKGAEVQCGLVETDWYASSVNLILAKPAGPLHIRMGDPVAHAVLIPRHLRRVSSAVAPLHSRLNREIRKELGEWDRHHRKDRSLYKGLARDHRCRVDSEK